MVFAALVHLFADIVQSSPFHGRQVGGVLFQFLLLLHQPFDVRQQVFSADAFRRIGIHAVHVSDALEGTLLGGEHPVDGAVLVHLLMVFPEVLHEVVVNGFAEALLHEVQVLHHLLFAQCRAQPLLEAGGGVVGKVRV